MRVHAQEVRSNRLKTLLFLFVVLWGCSPVPLLANSDLELNSRVYRRSLAEIGRQAGQSRFTTGRKIKEARRNFERQKNLYGEKHPITLAYLRHLASMLSRSNDYVSARRLHLLSFEIATEVLGPDTADLIPILNDLGILELESGHWSTARDYFEGVLRLGGEGASPRFLPTVYSNLGVVAWRQGSLNEALDFFSRSLALSDDPSMDIVTIGNRALVLRDLGRLGQAKEDLLGALSWLETHGHARQSVVVQIHQNLGMVLSDLADYEAARRFLLRALHLQKELAQSSFKEAILYNNLGMLEWLCGEREAALGYYRTAIMLVEELFGEKHPELALFRKNLAQLMAWDGDISGAREQLEIVEGIEKELYPVGHLNHAQTLGRKGHLAFFNEQFEEARRYWEDAIRIYQRVHPAHPEAITLLSSLAFMLLDRGHFIEGRRYLDIALKLEAQNIPVNHPNRARNQITLAEMAAVLGNTGAAIGLLEKAHGTLVSALGPGHADSILSGNRVAMLLAESGEPEKARQVFEKNIEILEENSGSELLLVSSMAGLAEIFIAKGLLLGAEVILLDALKIQREVEDGDPSGSIRILVNLGIVSFRNGDVVGAKSFFEEALESVDKSNVLSSLSEAVICHYLALISEFWQDDSEAIELWEQSISAKERYLEAGLVLGLEVEKARFVENTLLNDSDIAITLNLNRKSCLMQGRAVAYRVARLKKARSMIAALRDRRWMDRQVGSRARELARDVRSLRAERFFLTFRGANDLPERIVLERIEDIDKELENLTRAFLLLHPDRKLSAVDSQRALEGYIGTNVALIDIFTYEPYQMEADKLTESRYLAFVTIDNERSPVVLNLGEVDKIDEEITQFRVRISQRADFSSSANALFRVLMAPLFNEVELDSRVERLLIAPDGQFHLVPFGALLSSDGEYLIEKFGIAYLDTAEELIRSELAVSRRDPQVFGAPDFHANLSSSGQDVLGRRRLPDWMAGQRLSPLLFSAHEAAAVARLLSTQNLWLGSEANELRVKNLRRPSVLHVATHGYFMPSVVSTSNRLELGTSEVLTTGTADEFAMRSGLVLAGFYNEDGDAEDDGFLSSVEAADLDLAGTQLVVLSACETGVGLVENGRGIFGLRQSLKVAGALSVVMSLWQVEDAATSRFMSRFYEKLIRGTPRIDALREVQLEAMRGGAICGEQMRGAELIFAGQNSESWTSMAQSHPYCWASFILSGETGPLKF